ncbi:hypothetical protein E1287_20275 [Actinomadura sp. KC06]|nr:hypothetical protein E1287_20275 [Actinomadura sp. KC06]
MDGDKDAACVSLRAEADEAAAVPLRVRLEMEVRDTRLERQAGLGGEWAADRPTEVAVLMGEPTP